MVNTQSAIWYEQLVQLQKEVGASSFFASLTHTLKQVVNFDCSGVMFYNGNEVTSLFEGHFTETYREYIELYLKGLYLLDPHYSLLAKGTETGLYHFSDIASDCFHESKYYSDFIEPTGISDEFDFIVNINNCYIDFYSNHLGNQFTKQDIETLKSISPMMTYLIEEHWKIYNNEQSKSNNRTGMSHYQSIFDSFGKSVLTNREQDVVQCILHGHSSKSLATELDISLSTVKIHRKHIYQKLDITTQSELFSLCLQLLSIGELNESEDPLQALSTDQIQAEKINKKYR
jgi:DNA-binding CsgD family transcriptional regulator